MQQEKIPSIVPETATQDGEALVSKRWPWVELAVWTTRMLQALEKGVRGGVWFSLMDKVYAKRNLEAAATQVVKNRGSAGADHMSVQDFEKKREHHLGQLHDQLRTDTFHPRALRSVQIPKLGSRELRTLKVPAVIDRITQTALRNVLEPIFEQGFAEHSYGFRPGRSCKDALRRVDQLLSTGHHWVVDVDLKSFFDTIPHDKLMEQVQRKVADGKVLGLIQRYLEQSVLTDCKTWTPERGTPQGAVISPLLANVYLNPLDHLMAKHGFEMTRYADDMVIQCRSENDAKQAMNLLRQWTDQAGLELHPTKTSVVQVNEEQGFDFLGYHFQFSRGTPNKVVKWPRDKSVKKFKDKVRQHTRRSDGRGLKVIIARLNPVIRGFFEYFKHGRPWPLVSLDKWIRGRLRSILRRYTRRNGRGRGADHQRWPNAYFREHGLFSMAGERALLLQSSRR